MKNTPSKFPAYVSVLAGGLLLLGGAAALIGYLGMPVFLPYKDILAYQLGDVAAVYLGLLCGSLAIIHGLGSITGRRSAVLSLPAFTIFWIALALVLALGTLVLRSDIVPQFLFPPIFVLGAALSVFAVLGWAMRGLGWPVTWRQAALAFICGSTLSVLVAIILESTLPYIAYLLLEPFQYLAGDLSQLGWGAPGFIERLFASPLILVVLAVTAVQAPIPEEFAKALGLPIFGRERIQNERQAFAIGLASGAGFAILENMLYEGLYAHSNGWAWGGITLLRSIGSILHPLGTGIIALGWFRMRNGGIKELFKAYLLSVGLHTLWNGGFEPLVYLTGLDHFAGAGSSFSIYGQTLNVLLIGYLILLSFGLWWLMRRIVRELSQDVQTDLTPVPVSRKSVALWALVSALVIIPIGAVLSPAWESIRGLLSGIIR